MYSPTQNITTFLPQKLVLSSLHEFQNFQEYDTLQVRISINKQKINNPNQIPCLITEKREERKSQMAIILILHRCLTITGKRKSELSREPNKGENELRKRPSYWSKTTSWIRKWKVLRHCSEASPEENRFWRSDKNTLAGARVVGSSSFSRSDRNAV